MWVRVMGWMLADDEPPRPVAGAWLRSVGVRVTGRVTPADGATPDGVAEVLDARGAELPTGVYALTGIADEAQEVWTNTGRHPGTAQRAGAEFILTVGADLFQVQFEGRASEVERNSRVTVTGDLELVGDYEWEAFELSDTRADWIVAQVVALPEGDILVDLTHPPRR